MMRSKARGRGAQVVFPEASAAPGASARAPSRRRKASRANRTSASKKIATGARACCRSTFQASGFPARPTSSAATVKVGAGSGIGGERVEGDAGAYDARIGGGRVAAADRRRERRLEAELACGDGAEEYQVVRRPARRVKAHLPLHDLCLPAEPEPLQRADV